MKNPLQHTETAEGFIPHVPVLTDYGMIHAPVKLEVSSARKVLKDLSDRPYPLRRVTEGTGRLVYALPGGREFVP